MAVFISHISQEAPIAQILKGWIESTFMGQWQVFVSSDSGDIPVGSKWLDEIDKALTDAKVLIVLCSPASLKRPWINFEAGCGWNKRVPIIPVCHSGVTKSTLPLPLSLFQGLNVDDKDFPQALLSSLAKHLQVKQLPKIDYPAFHASILAALESVPASVDNVAEATSNAEKSPVDLQPATLPEGHATNKRKRKTHGQEDVWEKTRGLRGFR